jgi:hypothetical protein
MPTADYRTGSTPGMQVTSDQKKALRYTAVAESERQVLRNAD